MAKEPKVTRYWEYLARLNYPEYAVNHTANGRQDDQDSGSRLDLSLWNDDLPPGVAEVAMRALPRAVGAYGLAQDRVLIELLAQKFRTEKDNIIITAGADDALRVTAAYCVKAGTKTLIPLPCFGRYAYHAMVQEAKITYLPFNAYPFEFDVTRIIADVKKNKIDCLFVASPNNPTGHALDREAIKTLLGSVSCLVILDESLLLDSNLSCVELIEAFPNLFICGSFSKLYGMPGLRIGYLIANRAHAGLLRKLVSPFEVDALGLEIVKYMASQKVWLEDRVAIIRKSIEVLHSMDNPMLRVTRTTSPVALIEYVGNEGTLHSILSKRGVSTVAGEELLGLSTQNAVRVIIKNVSDMLQLKRILNKIS